MFVLKTNLNHKLLFAIQRYFDIGEINLIEIYWRNLRPTSGYLEFNISIVK